MLAKNSYQGFGSEYETLLNAFDKDIAGTYTRLYQGLRCLSQHGARTGKRHHLATLHVAEGSRDEGALQWQDSPSLGPWDACPSKNPFAQFHISPNCKEREFLTEEELKQVMTHDFEDADLAFVRDIFVFICWTALAFVDVKNLTTDDIVDINGDKWIVSHRHKTNVLYQVKLMDVPLQIIERYKHLQEDKYVFGKLNYWSICKKLKKVIAACGIEKQISLHCGRHSWATLALSKGMPIESVSRVLGHTNIVTTQIYARITSQKLNDDLTMLGDKLNKSFSNIKMA